MTFRQHNRQRRLQDRLFTEWRERMAELIRRSGLPPHLFATRDDWAYFAEYGYHQRGNWHTPFDPSLLTWSRDSRRGLFTRTQRAAQRLLHCRWAQAMDASPVLEKLL